MRPLINKFSISFLTILISLNVLAKKVDHPSAFSDLSGEYIHKIEVPLINQKSNSLFLPLTSSKKSKFNIVSNTLHNNGDQSFQAKTSDSKGYINATIGKNSIFGQMHYENTHYIITTEKSGSWLIELPDNTFTFNNCGHKNHINNGQPPQNKLKTAQSTTTVIDLLVVYNQALNERYPGELMQTRLNQYMNVTNQATVNSDLSLVFRLVGLEQIPYDQDNSNSIALNNMQESLSGNFVPGMQNLKQMREQVGADIVIFIRPHDIETRGSCGLARFPFSSDGVNFDISIGIHMISDGMSSWSLCTDQVMLHELGHNLGAGHNDVPAQFRYLPDAIGFAKPGQFATVMGSFGTGRPTRLFEVGTFSNPNVRCGGFDCGVPNEINNANVINQLKDIVAAYQPTVSTLPIPNMTRNNPDSDSDGVTDWEDPFPFDATETSDSDNDGTGDNADAFPSDASEQHDFDNDGVGDVQDTDDDNDGSQDNADAFPFNASESVDSDNDGIGDNADLFPNDFTEQHDYDADGMGDNLDNDDDNDTYVDLNIEAQDLLIINVGSNQILRLDAQTGNSHGVEILSTDGLLTFQSDLTYRQESQTLFYTSSSGVRRLNLMTREPLGLYVPPYDDNGGVQIGTGFPTSLSSINNGKSLAITRLNNFQILTIQGHEKTSFDFSYNWNLIEGDRPIDVISLGNTSYFLGQANFLYFSRSPTTIDVISTTNGFPQNWFDGPYAITVNVDNKLYITNQNSNSIGTVNIDDGEVVEMFIDLVSHGYSNPTGIVLANNNILLVAASDQNAVLKFNAQTGEFLGELVKGNGLNKPHKMILVPKLNDRFHQDINKVIKPNAGLWYNPETNGRGFDIQVFNNRLAVIWYTFDEQGLPTWYISSGDLIGFEYTGNFDKANLNPDGSFSLENIGSISIVFDDERNAQVNWEINNHQGSEAIQWLAFSQAEEIENYTGLWGRPDGPGWGVSVATIGKTSVAVPYIYDAAGEPRWLISNPVNTTAPLSFEFNAIFSDTLCPSCSGVSAFTTSPAGTMVLDLTTNKTWSSSVQFPAPITGEWILDNTEIKLFSSEATRPR